MCCSHQLNIKLNPTHLYQFFPSDWNFPWTQHSRALELTSPSCPATAQCKEPVPCCSGEGGVRISVGEHLRTQRTGTHTTAMTHERQAAPLVTGPRTLTGALHLPGSRTLSAQLSTALPCVHSLLNRITPQNHPNVLSDAFTCFEYSGSSQTAPTLS